MRYSKAILQRLGTIGRVALDTAANRLTPGKLSYLVEATPWTIQEVGKELVAALRSQSLLKGRVTTSPQGISSRIIHYGSLNTFSPGTTTVRRTHQRVVVTVWHVLPDDPRRARLPIIGRQADLIHTGCHSTATTLIQHGVPTKKIRIIPLGITTQSFLQYKRQTTIAIRHKYNIPDDAVVIGSFQKDGDGWGQGLIPKMEKGPDVLVKVCRLLRREIGPKLLVVLVGPSRGYVEKALQQSNIAYRSFGYQAHFSKIAEFYRLLDMYLISSRTEGGPRQILEAWVSGIPVVSTRVGMVPDIAKNDATALLTDAEDVAGLAQHCQAIASNPALAQRLATAGQAAVVRYDWATLAPRYYDTLYKPLL